MPVTAADRAEYEDGTAFERYAVTGTIPPHPHVGSTASIDLRHENGHVHIAMGVTENLSAGAVAAAVGRLRPLLFGAAYKILDLTLELGFDSAGLVPVNGRRWRFDEKVSHARAAAGHLPPFTDKHPDLWQRLCALYAVWEDTRHSLVHRTASVDPNTGDLAGRNRSGAILPTVTADDQEQFARVVVEVAEAVIGDDLDDRSGNRLAWRLNELARHHGLPRLPNESAPTNAVRVILNLKQLEDGRWRLDAGNILNRVRQTFQEATEFDAECHALAGNQDHVFECKLEEAPEVIDFDLAFPPAWLRKQHLD